MKRTALALSAFLAACSAPPATGERSQGIINGSTDTGDPAVVLVIAQTSSTMGSLCTGSIVSPHVVLTAAHCVDPDVLMTQTATFTVFTGMMLAKGAPASDFLSVKETHFDTAFDQNAPQNGHDVGVVILNSPAPIAPIPYNRSPMTQAMIGQDARFVGYGITSGSDTQGTTAGTRRTAPTKLATLDNLLLGFDDGVHGICEGDSGGPAFMTIGGKELIVGVTSFGLMGCPLMPEQGVQPGNDTRIDTYSDFIDGWVKMFDPPAKGAGQQCDSDADCYPLPCQDTGAGKICVQSCDPMAMTTSCAAGTMCSDVDGSNICAPPMMSGGKSGGCDLGGGAPLPAAGLFVVALAALVLRRRRATSAR